MHLIPNHRTKIVCTLGPSTDKPGVLEKILRAGMDVARLNAAHSDFDVHRERLKTVRAAAASLGVPIAILMDLPGPKHRIGRLSVPSLALRQGTDVVLGIGEPGEGVIPLDDRSLLKDLRAKDLVYLADGTVRLIVTKAGTTQVKCHVEFGGFIRSGSGLNLPTSNLSVQLPTPDDRLGMAFACDEGVEWIGISFVRTAQDILNVRKRLPTKGHRPMIMAKIEKREALDNLSAIIAEADGVMVARGDLGVETPLEAVPLAQKRIIAEGIQQGKPIITATQMLESMVEHSSPTRAEVTDVANAVLDGTDAVMLSGETAIGSHPIHAVQTLDRVIGATEAQYPFGSHLQRFSQVAWTSLTDAISLSACRLAYDLQASAIVVSSDAAASAFRISRFRPEAPVIVFTRSHTLTQQLNLGWNVHPVASPGAHVTEVSQIRRLLLKTRLVKAGDRVVLVFKGPHVAVDASDALQVIRL
jgi:pyruvate kinase